LKTISLNLIKLNESDFEDLEVKVEKICCEFCEEKFFVPANLDLHVQRNHQSASADQQFKCLFCKKVFKQQYTYNKHLNLLHKNKAILCKFTQCFAVFRTKQSLGEHLKQKHLLAEGKKPIECKVCKIWFFSKNYLKIHIKNQHGIKIKNKISVECEFCTETFESKAKLCHHTKENHKEAIECRLKPCYLYFKSKEEMEKHFTNAHVIKCKICNSCFSSKTSYTYHLKKLHLENRCKFHNCSFYGESKDELEKHLKEKHSQKSEKHFECVYCGKHFIENRFSFFSHVRKFHSKIAIRCIKPGCGMFFTSLEDLEEHKKEAHQRVERHKQSVECLYCQKINWDKAAYAHHIKSCHSEEAIRCKYRKCLTFFKSQEDRIKHHEKKHVEKFSCALCDYKTLTKHNLPDHFERHHFPKEIKCPHCPEVFGYIQILKYHIANNHEPKKKCPHCTNEISGNLLLRHVVTANCPICSQPFPCRKLFSDHKLKCKKIHQCGDCGKIFQFESRLKYHISEKHRLVRNFRGSNVFFATIFSATETL